ncbi:hypothetical protein [Nocardioides nanhaiensis]|uniref:Uncharacterized protein n=1 Tax=Nocardioides nanhaiensis TaxID=1476871 RepID=A0ABP8WQ19_9ACTN
MQRTSTPSPGSAPWVSYLLCTLLAVPAFLLVLALGGPLLYVVAPVLALAVVLVMPALRRRR